MNYVMNKKAIVNSIKTGSIHAVPITAKQWRIQGAFRAASPKTQSGLFGHPNGRSV